MKKTLLFTPLLALLLALAGTAQAADQTFSIDIEIRSPITFSVINPALDFGIIESPGAVTTVEVFANDGPHNAGVGAASAKFDVSGDACCTATVSTSVTTTLGLTNAVTLSPSSATLDFTTGSPKTLWIGGTLDVDPADPTGTHTGQGTVTVLYQ